MRDLAGVLVPLGFFTLAFLIVWTITQNRRKRIESGTEMRVKVLDKFGSSQELVEYLKSDVGQKFFAPPPVGRACPKARILRSIHVGLIAALGGAALLVVGTAGVGGDRAEGRIMVGAVAVAVGVAFLISAGISYRLSKSWGLFDQDSANPR